MHQADTVWNYDPISRGWKRDTRDVVDGLVEVVWNYDPDF